MQIKEFAELYDEDVVGVGGRALNASTIAQNLAACVDIENLEVSLRCPAFSCV